MMVNIAWFKDISKDSVSTVGGKGANLGEMYRFNFPIPNGFVVTAEAYRDFMTHNSLQTIINQVLENLNLEDSDALNKASEKIQDIVLSKEVPLSIKNDIKKAYDHFNLNVDLMHVPEKTKHFIQAGRDYPFVAVRSSATAEDLPEFSFAGQQATYLNVRGVDNLIQAVHQCWASLYTARAIYYRTKNNFDHSKVYIAVVVQKMVDSEKAGVMFSMNPATNNENEIIIEASFGFGDAVVSGAVSPDRYVVDKESLEIKNIKVNQKEFMYYRDPQTGRNSKKLLSFDKAHAQVLSEDEIKKLAVLAKKSENHYNHPQDMEFAIEGPRIFLVQTRAITTQKKVSEINEKEVVDFGDAKEILTGIGASPGVGKGKVKIVTTVNDLSKVEKGDVLVAEMTDPDYVAVMQRASAIVTDQGGSTCHAAIVSREMGIPSVVGTQSATKILRDNMIITVDGTNGKVYSGEINIEVEKEEEEIQTIQESTVTKIKTIVDMPEFAEKAAKTGADGVGLIRAEFMILKNKTHPAYMIEHGNREELVNLLYDGIKKIASAFKDKPVWYRTLDMRSDEYDNLEGGNEETKEDNPMMGWHGIRRDLDQPELLRAQLEAIQKVHNSGLKNVGVMLPLVTHIEQVRLVKGILKEMGMENMEFGVMVETPASVQLIEDFCQEGIKFISIGSNDLTQFTLAVDRNNAKVQKIYDAMHPAVLKSIRYVIKTCKRYKVKTSLCGQAGSDPEMAKQLVDMGIDSIAVNTDAVHKVRHAVAEEERKLVLDIARGRE